MATAARQFGARAGRSRPERMLPSRRPEAGRQWYFTEAWRRIRAERLRLDKGLCRECVREGKPLHRCTGNIVDHVKPHNGDAELFFDLDNTQTLCATHHSRKTCKRDGGFGHRRAE